MNSVIISSFSAMLRRDGHLPNLDFCEEYARQNQDNWGEVYDRAQVQAARLAATFQFLADSAAQHAGEAGLPQLDMLKMIPQPLGGSTMTLQF